MEIAPQKKILLITSGQPSLNPRLIKEADTLTEAGHHVTVLYAYWNDWGARLNASLLATRKWDAICVGGDPINKRAVYFFTRLIHKIAKSITRIGMFGPFPAFAAARGSFSLIRGAKKHSADLYIGHNLGALPAVIKAAKLHHALSGFDAEDFHRNDVSNDQNNPDVIIKSQLEKRYFPNLSYISTSSPLIASTYTKLFPKLAPEVILNVFPTDKRIAKPVQNNLGPIKLFWFSQTIGHSRGLEEVINAIETFEPNTYELHLLGHQDASFKLPENKNFYVHAPIPPDELINFASQFDVGLAAETGIPLNRDICLTNKIFTYIQAGLCVVASDTSAQTQLLDKYPGIGKIYQKKNQQSLANVLRYYHQHRNELFDARIAAFETGRNELNWENESKKVLQLVKNTLNNK